MTDGPGHGRPDGPKPVLRGPRARLLAVLGVVVALLLAVAVYLLTRGTPGGETDPAPSPTPSGGAGPTPSVPTYAGTPAPAQQELLDEAVGFASGVTGGAGGTVVHVDTDAESGPGSLRTAVRGDQPKWVVFDRDVTIKLTSALVVGSNTTIDGRGRDVDISGPGVSGLVLQDVSNVIIESLTLHDFGDTTRTPRNDPDDAIRLAGATGVWVDHNDLSRTGDKVVAVAGGSSGVTVSWNHFHDQEQTFQIGNQADAKASLASTVTVHHNFFDRDGYRMPVVGYGKVHIYNNYYLDWRLFAVRSERGAEVYLERNVFDGARGRLAVRTRPAGDGCNDAVTRCDSRPGLLREVDNLLLGDTRPIKESSPDGVFDPRASYAYSADPATVGLAGQVRERAGPRD